MLGLGSKKPKSEVRRRAVITEDPSFRRTHTISGFDPAVVLEKDEQILERKKVQSLVNRKRKINAVIISFFVIVVLCVIGLFLYSATISNVNTQNQITGQVNKEKFISTAEGYFKVRPIERFSFFLNNKSFSAFMSKNILEVETATINNRGFLSGELSVKIREPVAVWQANGQKQYIDGNGVVFSNNLMAEPSIVIEDNTLGAVSTLPAKFLRFIGKVIAGIEKDSPEKVKKVVIPNTAIRYIEIHLTGRAYPFKAHIDRNVQSQVGDILNMIKFLDSRHIVPRYYVDNRVESKGYWK